MDFSTGKGPDKKPDRENGQKYGRRNGDLPNSHIPREQRSRAVRGLIADRRGKPKRQP